MAHRIFTSICCLILILSADFSFAQDQNLVGFNLSAEQLSSPKLLLGLSFERQVTKHSGIETGIFYRRHLQGNNFPTEYGNYSVDIMERYISIPVLYKYRSKIVDVAAGLTFDQFVGWKEKFVRVSNPDVVSVEINDYNINPDLFIGFMLKISRTIPLSPKIILEPEIRINPLITKWGSYNGFGINCRYKL